MFSSFKVKLWIGCWIEWLGYWWIFSNIYESFFSFSDLVTQVNWGPTTNPVLLMLWIQLFPASLRLEVMHPQLQQWQLVPKLIGKVCYFSNKLSSHHSKVSLIKGIFFLEKIWKIHISHFAWPILTWFPDNN